jgi:GT2 family glycosyltransferase
VKQPLVYIVIVSYNGRHNLEYCLPTLVSQDYPNFKIFIADNNSTDNTQEWLKHNHPEVYLIKQDKNIGMAAMNEVLTWPAENGLPEIPDYIFVAGWDLKFDRRCISHAVELMNEKKDIGLLGFEVIGLFDWADPSELDSRSANWRKTEFFETDWVPGACSFYRADLLRAVGFLDPAYFAYAEEDDMQFRVKESNFKRVIINTPCWQNVRESAIPLAVASYLSMRNTIRFQIKNRSLMQGLRTALLILNNACSPFVTLDLSKRVNQRMRPFSLWSNFMIWAKAFLWNLVNLKDTLNASREVVNSINRGKQLFDRLNSGNNK